jgi:hypothetical protein
MGVKTGKLLLLAAIALLVACGNDTAPELTEFAVPQDVAVVEDEDESGVISLMLGGTRYEYPAEVCEIRQGFTMVQGKDGESGIAIQADVIGVQASFQYHFKEDGERYWNTWDSQRGMQHSIAGNTISAGGTMKRVGRRVAQGEAIWEYVQGIEVLEESFTLSATCPQ